MFPTRKLAFLAAGLAMLLAAPSAAVAATDKGEATPLNLPSTDGSQATTASSGGGLVRTFVGLAIVLGVIYGLYWVLKQVKSSRETAASGQGLESVATHPARHEPLAAPRARRQGARAPRRRRAGGRADPRLPRGGGPRARAHRHGGHDRGRRDDLARSPRAASAAVALRDVFGRLQQRTVRS